MQTINAHDDLLPVLCSLILVVRLYIVTKLNLLLLLVLLKLIFLLQSLVQRSRCTLDRSYELGFVCKEATPIYEDNASTINIVNSSVPIERARHIYIRYFAIQDWKEWGCIELIHIPGILNPSDNLNKPLGWVLHSRHCRRFTGYYA